MVMINQVLNILRDKLELVLQNALFRTEKWVVLANPVDQDGSIPDELNNKVLMSVESLQSDTSTGAFVPPSIGQGDRYPISAPPLFVDVYVLVMANFSGGNYAAGIGMLSRVISDGDLEVGARPVAGELQVLGADVAAEAQEIEPRLDRTEREAAALVDHVLTVAALEDVDVPAGPARHEVVVLAAPQYVAGTRPDQVVAVRSRRTLLVDHLHRHAEAVPDHSVGKDDGVDAALELLARAGVVVELAEDLVDQQDGVGAPLDGDREDQVLPLAGRLSPGST